MLFYNIISCAAIIHDCIFIRYDNLFPGNPLLTVKAKIKGGVYFCRLGFGSIFWGRFTYKPCIRCSDQQGKQKKRLYSQQSNFLSHFYPSHLNNTAFIKLPPNHAQSKKNNGSSFSISIVISFSYPVQSSFPSFVRIISTASPPVALYPYGT